MGEGTVTATRVTIGRPEILARLREGADAPLVLIRGGAGYGKTTLATLWAEQDERSHALLRVSPFMDDPHTLTLHLVDALESLGVSAHATRDIITAAEPGFSALALPALTGLARAADRYVLVVDDVHLLTDPDCHAVLQAVSAGIPAGSQLALLSRSDPPSWVARVRAEAGLVDVGPEELAFSDAESREFLARLGWDLDHPDTARLVEESEGWPVGLYLMALTAGRGARDGRVVRPSGPDHFVLDYIRGEVLAGLSDRTRTFLRRTSVVDEQQSSLCDVLVGRKDSARELSALARRLQLVTPVDGTGHRYRYHHLLTDALRVDLAEQEPWLEAELHSRASEWYEHAGRWDDAVRHATFARDLARLSRLVWAGLPACLASGRPDRLRGWLAVVDPAALREDRWLTLAAAWLGLQTGDPDEMTRFMLAADVHAGPGWPLRAASDEYAASLAALHVLVGDHGLRGTIELCQGVQQGLPRDSGFRASAFHNEGLALTLIGHREEGMAKLAEGKTLARALGVPIIEANSLAWEGFLALVDDDWGRGTPLVAAAAELVRRHRLERLATSVVGITMGSLLHATRGSKQEARVWLGTARRLTQQVAQIAPWFSVMGPLVQCRVALLLGEPSLAGTLCSQAREHLAPDLAHTVLAPFLADTERLVAAVGADAVSAAALTPAELRILQYLPSRLTFPQIGDRLFISQNTVKTHAMAIYRKLGVTARDEAVSRARSLGLVESLPRS